MIKRVDMPEKAAHLFREGPEGILRACLQKVMGEVYTVEGKAGRLAMAILGDFCFLGGEADRELAAFKPEGRRGDFIMMIPGDGEWAGVLEGIYGSRIRKRIRYATKKEKDAFCREHLERIVQSLSGPYVLRRIDEELYVQCLQQEWSQDLVSQYPDYETYRRLGMGWCVMDGNRLLSGASSYASYVGGIEIEIDTRESERRKGLALTCGARLILDCLDREWYPSWDAHNEASLRLAERLGYHRDYDYEVFEIWGY